MTRIKYTEELLHAIIEKTNAILIGTYPKMNSKTLITYKCTCGEECTKQFGIIYQCSGGAYCKVCVEKHRREKTIKTNMEKYGGIAPINSTEIKDKILKTCMKKYGVKRPAQDPSIIQKTIKSNMEKYGVSSPNSLLSVREKIMNTNMKIYGVKSTLQCTDVKEKIKQTNLQKYGVENPLESKDIQDKVKETNLQKYGVEYPQQSEEIHKKSMETCYQHFGVYHPQQSKEVYAKSVETSLQKYGTHRPSQSTEIQEKIQMNSKARKDYKMPSGDIRRVQGYEPFALDELIKHYSEDQLITDRKKIPRIQYQKNNKSSYYFPDIFIPHENKIIEIKSTWTYTAAFVKEKAQATKENGYNYEIWVYTKKGEKTVYTE